jgi:hypothetical protein
MEVFKISDLREKFTHKKYRQDRWSSDEEATILCKYIKAFALNTVYEIGTGYGFSAACMRNVGAKVYTFDSVDHHKIYLDPNFPVANRFMNTTADKVVFKQVPSPDCFNLIVPTPDPVLFFVDGDHGRGPMMRDATLIKKICRVDDVAIFRGVVSEAPAERFWVNFREQNPATTTTIKTQSGLGIYKP